jgi:hypothetical protein
MGDISYKRFLRFGSPCCRSCFKASKYNTETYCNDHTWSYGAHEVQHLTFQPHLKSDKFDNFKIFSVIHYVETPCNQNLMKSQK